MDDYKLVIFDWDGTVMDSVGRIVSSMQGTASDLELAMPSAEQVKNIIGLSLPTALAKLFPEATNEEKESIRKRYHTHYVELDQTPTPLFDHATELFEQLLAQDKKLAVATGKGRDGIERIWQNTQTKHYFHTSRCAYECQSKPHPEMIEQILDELELLPHQAVMIGDTVHDMAMAKNANVDRIGVSFGVHDRATLLQYQPKAVVDSLYELASLLVKS